MIIALLLASSFVQSGPVIERDGAGRVLKEQRRLPWGATLEASFLYGQRGNVTSESYQVSSERGTTLDLTEYDGGSGDTVRSLQEVRTDEGGFQAVFTYSGGAPDAGALNETAPDGTWRPVRLRVHAPRIVDDRSSFSLQIQIGDGTTWRPLPAGSLVEADGVRQLVTDFGVASIPPAGRSWGVHRFMVKVWPAVAGGTLVLDPLSMGLPVTFESRVLPLSAAVTPKLVSADASIHPGVPLRVFGSGLTGLRNLALADPRGGRVQLGPTVGSRFEQLTVRGTPVLSRETAYQVVAELDGEEVSAPGTVSRVRLETQMPALGRVGERQSLTIASNADTWVRIAGGDPVVRLDRRIVFVPGGQAVNVGYTVAQEGIARVEFEPSAAPDEGPDDPECETEVGKAAIEDGKPVVPVKVTDTDGKPISGQPCELAVSTPEGVYKGTCTTDREGHAKLQLPFGAEIDLSAIVAVAASVPGHRPAASEVVDDGKCCIKELTLTNDTDQPVYYTVYTPRTGGQPRVEHGTTQGVPPGGSVTLRGDFGQCVRVAALRRTADAGGPGPGLISDRQYCCHKQGTERVRSSADGLRSVTVVAGRCGPPARPPAPPEAPPLPPEPEPPTPPDPEPKWTEFGTLGSGLDWGKWPKLSYPLTGDLTSTPPPPSVTSKPSDVQPSKGVEGWFQPVQSVWQDDQHFPDKPGKRLVRLAPSAWRAELDMVADKPTLVAGLRIAPDGAIENRRFVRFKGIATGDKWERLKLRVTLMQGGGERVVYESSSYVTILPVAGGVAPGYPFDVSAFTVGGFPEENSSWRPFKMAPGAYELRAQLVTMDGRPTDIQATVVGNAARTLDRTVYFLPAALQSPIDQGEVSALMSATLDLSRATGMWGQSVFPVRVGGVKTHVLPFVDLSAQIQKAGRGFFAFFSETIAAGQRREELIAIAANLLSVFSHLAGNGKIVVVTPAADFDLTGYLSSDTAAFCPNQKVIVIQRPFARYMTTLHEYTHATPHLWSVDEMQATFGFTWHNNPTKYIADGVRIYGDTPFRRWHTAAPSMMGPATHADNDTLRWITQGAYWHLLDYFKVSPDPELIDVHGFLARTETGVKAMFAPFYTQMGLPEPQLAQGDYAVVLRAADGRQLSRTPLSADWSWGDLQTPARVVPFSLRLLRPEGLAQVELVGPEGILATRTISPAPPEVEVTSAPITVSEDARSVTLAWRARTSNGEAAWATVLFSPDGETWAYADVQTEESGLAFTLTGELTAPRIRLIVSDGSQSREIEVPVTLARD